MKRPAAALALMCLAVTAAGAQGPAVFRSSVQLVALNVTVTNQDQQFVRGLQAEDFAIFEDGVPQRVQLFEAADVPLDLILLLDTSSSMTNRMPVVHEAAVGFLSTLREGDRGAVVAFADRVDVVQTLTTDRGVLEQAVRRTRPRGATALHDAIYISLKQFGRAAQQDGDIRRQAIAVLTDGEDTSSLLDVDAVIDLARKSGVSVYPITLQPPEPGALRREEGGRSATQMQAQYSLRQLAHETGARPFFTVQLSGLEDVYSSIAAELSSQYSLAYAPSDTTPDGRFRRIVVQVASRPDLRLRTRTGYVVAGAASRVGRESRSPWAAAAETH